MVSSSARHRVHGVEWTATRRGIGGRKPSDARKTKRNRYHEERMPPGQVEVQRQCEDLGQRCAYHSRGQTDQGKLAEHEFEQCGPAPAETRQDSQFRAPRAHARVRAVGEKEHADHQNQHEQHRHSCVDGLEDGESRTLSKSSPRRPSVPALRNNPREGRRRQLSATTRP